MNALFVCLWQGLALVQADLEIEIPLPYCIIFDDLWGFFSLSARLWNAGTSHMAQSVNLNALITNSESPVMHYISVTLRTEINKALPLGAIWPRMSPDFNFLLYSPHVFDHSCLLSETVSVPAWMFFCESVPMTLSASKHLSQQRTLLSHSLFFEQHRKHPMQKEWGLFYRNIQ